LVKTQLLVGKHLVSIRLQMRGLNATKELVTLTKEAKIDQCERVSELANRRQERFPNSTN